MNLLLFKSNNKKKKIVIDGFNFSYVVLFTSIFGMYFSLTKYSNFNMIVKIILCGLNIYFCFKLINELKYDRSGLYFSLIIAILGILLSNEILILQANGLTVKRGKKERIYKWDEFCTKLVVNAKGERGRSKYINFSKYKYIQGRGLPAVFYQLISSNLIISIAVGNGNIKAQKDGCFYDCIDEEIVAEKLKEWHVELSGDNLGKLPWNE